MADTTLIHVVVLMIIVILANVIKVEAYVILNFLVAWWVIV